MNTTDTICLLNRLSVLCKNSQHNLRAAAEEAHHEPLKQLLFEHSRHFQAAALEMQEIVRQLGGRPRLVATFDSTLHRAWMHMKISAMGRDENEILNEVEPDEIRAKRCFAQAAQEETDPAIHALLERWHEGLLKDHAELHDWRGRIHA